MPRNSNGTYSLPTGNPVVTGTTISSTWANTTLTDIGNALTDSLSRSGDGGMQAPLLLDNGAIGAPGLSWVSEGTSGIYRAGAGDFRYSVSSTDRVQITTQGLGVLAGSAASPSGFFIADPDTGVYSVSANRFGISTGGTSRFRIDSTGLDLDVALHEIDGSAGTPSYSFGNDLNTGFYSSAADQIGFSCGGTQRLFLSTTALVPNGGITLGTSAAKYSQVFAGELTDGASATGSIATSSGATLILGAGSGWTSTQIRANSANDLISISSGTITFTLGGAAAGTMVQGSYTGTLTGCTTSPTCTVSYQRVGKLVMLSIPPVSGTSNATTMTLTGAPAAIRPASLSSTGSVANIFNNSGTPDDVPYSANMNSSGVLEFNRGISGPSGFTAGGTKGVSNTNGASGTSFYYYVT